MKKSICILLLSLGFAMIVHAQGAVSGTVIDAETKAPLEGASVFAQNTTRGTLTRQDGSFRLELGKGGFELVVSFTGYVSQRINVDGAADQTFSIELKKEEKNLGEVVIRSSSEVTDGWDLYGGFFIDYFLGATPFSDSCTILNPDALQFYYFKRSDKLKVLATEPVLIANRALGYNLRYVLDSFVYFFKTDINTYRGSCLYQQMEGTASEQAQWTNNRLKAYHGSRLHFLRAYYDSTLKTEGFFVDMLSNNDLKKFNRLSNPYDSAYYYFDDSSSVTELYFPKKVSITYTRQKPEREYLVQMKLPPDVKLQISYVDLLDGILIMQNGYFIDQSSWINQGYWSWKNIADQLPYDYEPFR